MNESIAYITCSFCGGEFQALNTDGTDSDNEALSAMMQNHWSKCTSGNPYTDPNGAYES
jgi:hypothetical protein